MCVTGRLLICLYLSKPDMLLCVFVCVCVFGIKQVFTWCLNELVSTQVMWASTLPLCCRLTANTPTWCRGNMFMCWVNNSRAEFISMCEHAELINRTMCVPKQSQQVQELWDNGSALGCGRKLILVELNMWWLICSIMWPDSYCCQ